MKQVKLEVSGMSCGHCIQAVRNALSAIPGAKVENVQIGAATVNFDEARTTIGALVDAVADAGYEASEAA